MMQWSPQRAAMRQKMRFAHLWYQRRLRALALRLDRCMPVASLRTYLVAMILLATLPIALLLTYNVASDVRSGRRAASMLLQQTASTLAQTVEQDLTISLDALKALSLVEALQQGDLPAFAQYLRQTPLLRSQWRSVFVTDSMGRLLLDTASIHNAPAPLHEQTRALVFSVLARTRAAVSNVSWHPVEGTRVVVLAVPVYQDGVVQHVLGTRISAETWMRQLEGASVPAEGYIALLDDSEGTIAFKGASAEPGSKALEAPVQLMAHALPAFQRRRDSSRSAVLLETDAVIAAWQRVEGTGWHISAGLPAAPIGAAEHSIVLSAVTTMGLCLLMGVTLALLLAWRLAEPLRRLAAAGAVRPGQHLPVLEIAQLRQALQQARQRDQAARTLLHHKAEEFETLFNSNPIGLAFAQDGSGRRVIYNPAMQALLGMAGSMQAAGSVEMLYRGRRLVPQEQPLLRACLQGESVRAMEMEVRVPGRSPAFVVASAVPLLDAQGRARGAMSAIMDITELKQVVALWLAADEGQQARQRLIDLAQEAGHVGFFEYTFHSDALVCTSGLRQLLRVPEEVPLAHLKDWLALVHAEDAPGLRRTLARAVAQRSERVNVEYRVRCAQPQAGARWLSSRLLLHYGSSGQPEHATGTTVDATEQKEAQLHNQRQAAQELLARQQAEAANRAKDEFLTMLSHELRNPLGAITAALEVLASGSGGAAMAERALAIMTRQTQHLTHMVGDLLDAGRVVTSKVGIVLAPLDLAQVVERVRASLDMQGQLQAYDWTFDLAPVRVHGDAVRLEQIVTNLLANAMQYSAAGGAIAVAVRAEGEQVLLQVRDEGCGIAPALLPHVFELFVQGERPLHRRDGGLGVGLTLVQRLVQLHGGTVAAHSAPGKGATFTVLLPALEPGLPETLAGAEAPGAGLRGRPRTSLNVVLLEDNDDMRQSLQAMLELDGHCVAWFQDGLAGLACILAQRPDAAIVDIGLPGLDGFAVARRARAGGYAGRLVAVTGYGQEHSRRDALKAGFDAYLVKPVSADQWRSALCDTA